MKNNLDFFEEFKKTDEYKKVDKVVSNLIVTGMLERFRNNCIGASDIIQNYLSDVGIDSRVIECTLSIISHSQDGEIFYFLGYDGIIKSGEIDTHVVVVTDTKVPMLIDMSISHILPSDSKFVFQPLNGVDNVLSSYNFNDTSLTYRNKQHVKFPALHQKTLLQKINEERKQKETFSFLKIMIGVAIAISILNFSLNMFQIVLRLHLTEPHNGTVFKWSNSSNIENQTLETLPQSH
jgi:hypothetical protein